MKLFPGIEDIVNEPLYMLKQPFLSDWCQMVCSDIAVGYVINRFSIIKAKMITERNYKSSFQYLSDTCYKCESTINYLKKGIVANAILTGVDPYKKSGGDQKDWIKKGLENTKAAVGLAHKNFSVDQPVPPMGWFTAQAGRRGCNFGRVITGCMGLPDTYIFLMGFQAVIGSSTVSHQLVICGWDSTTSEMDIYNPEIAYSPPQVDRDKKILMPGENLTTIQTVKISDFYGNDAQKVFNRIMYGRDMLKDGEALYKPSYFTVYKITAKNKEGVENV